MAFLGDLFKFYSDWLLVLSGGSGKLVQPLKVLVKFLLKGGSQKLTDAFLSHCFSNCPGERFIGTVQFWWKFPLP